MTLFSDEFRKIGVPFFSDCTLISEHLVFREARETIYPFSILNSSFIHGREEQFSFLYLTGATESQIFVQELLKTLTSSSTVRSCCSLVFTAVFDAVKA